MIQPAIMMAVAGAALLGGSMLWSAASDRRPAAILQPKPTTTTGVQRTTGATAPTAPTASAGGQVSNLRPAGQRLPQGRGPAPQGGPPPVAPITQVTPAVDGAFDPHLGASPTADATKVMPAQTFSSHDQMPAEEDLWSITGPTPEIRRGQQWVEGIGYVDDEGSAS